MFLHFTCQNLCLIISTFAWKYFRFLMWTRTVALSRIHFPQEEPLIGVLQHLESFSHPVRGEIWLNIRKVNLGKHKFCISSTAHCFTLSCSVILLPSKDTTELYCVNEVTRWLSVLKLIIQPLSDVRSPIRKHGFQGNVGGGCLYLSRAEKQRMYSVIQRSSTTASCDRLIFSRSADRARRRSRLELRLSDSRRVWTQALDVWLCERRNQRERERSRFRKAHQCFIINVCRVFGDTASLLWCPVNEDISHNMLVLLSKRPDFPVFSMALSSEPIGSYWRCKTAGPCSIF